MIYNRSTSRVFLSWKRVRVFVLFAIFTVFTVFVVFVVFAYPPIHVARRRWTSFLEQQVILFLRTGYGGQLRLVVGFALATRVVVHQRGLRQLGGSQRFGRGLQGGGVAGRQWGFVVRRLAVGFHLKVHGLLDFLRAVQTGELVSERYHNTAVPRHAYSHVRLTDVIHHRTLALDLIYIDNSIL